MNDMNIIVDNYRESLEQKYNAVCFDIDGTLTMDDSKKIDERAIKMIAELLKRKIPVVFITGRGETGLNDLKNDVYYKLVNIYKVNAGELKRTYALTNDGARLFYTLKGNMFDNSVYISTDKELNELKQFNENIINYADKFHLNSLCDMTYSEDSVNKRLLNVRFILLNDEKETVESLKGIINETIKNNKLYNLTITRGIYKGRTVIQIGTTKKDVAIEKAEKIIGIPKDSMIRIGDCGDIIGNDYSMLNCQQGYSVDKTSNMVDRCFPIFDENNKILKGVEATLFLIKSAKILPTICLESADKQEYVKKYAKIEYDIVHGRNKYLIYYNNVINNNFNTVYGINDLFDSSSGSIKIPMHEWEILDNNNPLKRLFEINSDDKLFYSLRDNFNYLLRGSKVYYYFLANRYNECGNDYTSKENVKEWYENTLLFLKNAIYALNIKYDYTDIISKKLILGLLDNIRNILLLQINHNLISMYPNESILININSRENEYINELYSVLYLNEKLMADICFDSTFIFQVTDIKKILNMTNVIISNEFYNFLKADKGKDYSKEYRAYREIDNFAENYITMCLDFDKNKCKNDFGVCGTCYGGLELPVIYKVVNPNIKNILLLKFDKKVSGYKNKQLIDLRKFNINNYGGLSKIGEIDTNNIVLLDDNILTGKTMQLSINSLYDIGINTSNISIVRYPSINRVEQMFMEKHGAVDFNLFFDYVTGLCFCSPYSWVDEKIQTSYLDSLGIFDLNREKIIECLIKNHDYKENSEVYNCKRRIKK